MRNFVIALLAWPAYLPGSNPHWPERTGIPWHDGVQATAIAWRDPACGFNHLSQADKNALNLALWWRFGRWRRGPWA